MQNPRKIEKSIVLELLKGKCLCQQMQRTWEKMVTMRPTDQVARQVIPAILEMTVEDAMLELWGPMVSWQSLFARIFQEKTVEMEMWEGVE